MEHRSRGFPDLDAGSLRQWNSPHARYLIERHTVTEARARGWQQLENGDLLRVAESAGFDVLVTTDKNLGYQQNLAGRRIAIVVLGQGRWTLIKPYIPRIATAIDAAGPGTFIEVEIPRL